MKALRNFFSSGAPESRRAPRGRGAVPDRWGALKRWMGIDKPIPPRAGPLPLSEVRISIDAPSAANPSQAADTGIAEAVLPPPAVRRPGKEEVVEEDNGRKMTYQKQTPKIEETEKGLLRSKTEIEEEGSKTEIEEEEVEEKNTKKDIPESSGSKGKEEKKDDKEDDRSQFKASRLSALILRGALVRGGALVQTLVQAGARVRGVGRARGARARGAQARDIVTDTPTTRTCCKRCRKACLWPFVAGFTAMIAAEAVFIGFKYGNYKHFKIPGV